MWSGVLIELHCNGYVALAIGGSHVFRAPLPKKNPTAHPAQLEAAKSQFLKGLN
jgi:hypothetical protein